MLAGGIVLIVVALIFGVVHIFSRRKMGHLLTARVTRVGELIDTARTVAGELGGGGFTENAALTGTVRCDRPLVAPLSERPCLYYRMTVRRRYEEQVERRDSDGDIVRETRRGTETMSTQEEGTHFELVDGEHHLPVAVGGIDWKAQVETVDQFQPEAPGLQLSFGRFSMALNHGGGLGRRTLGYEYEEHLVPLDGQFTLIGQVTDSGGPLTMRRGGPIFSISRESRDEQIGSAKGTASWTAAASGICLLIGAILAVVGALR